MVGSFTRESPLKKLDPLLTYLIIGLSFCLVSVLVIYFATVHIFFKN